MTKFPDLVTFTDEILNGKLHFSLSKNISNNTVVVMAFKFLSVNLRNGQAHSSAFKWLNKSFSFILRLICQLLLKIDITYNLKDMLVSL